MAAWSPCASCFPGSSWVSAIAFAFTFYWGFIQHKELFFVNLESSSPYLALYFGSGVVLIIFALFAFVTGE